jgi:PHP family Zn ribbon phosphoesterase
MAEPKLATCCYCGTRATLRLSADRHVLACGGCGAPLTRMKPLRPEEAAEAARHPHPKHPVPLKRRKKRKAKRRKGLFEKIVREVWDEIEDIFD